MSEPSADNCRIGRLAWPTVALLIGLGSTRAEAHTPLQGIGGFWSGVAHLLTSPEQVAFLIGLGIWVSFHDQRLDTRVIGVVFVAVFTGVFIGARLPAAD